MVKLLFLFIICLVPLGLLAALSFRQLARKANAEGDTDKAVTLRARAAEKFLYALVSGLLAALGYWIVTRNVIPQLQPEWVLLVFVFVLAGTHFIIRRALNVPKWKDWF